MVKVIEKIIEKKRHRKDASHAMPAFFRILISTLFLAFMAGIYTWFILWRQNLGDSGAVDKFIAEKPELFVYSYIIIVLVMLLIAAITWKPFLTAGVVFAIISGVTYAHIQKFTIRQIPLLPEDLVMAGQLGGMMEFVNIEEVMRLAFGIAFVIVGSALLDHFAKKIFGHKNSKLAWWERWSLVPRATLSMVVLTILVLVASPVVRDKKQGSDAVDWIQGMSLTAWDQAGNYRDNGFVIGFLYNLGTLKAEEPQGYSEEKVAQILGKYENMRKADETEREPLADVVDNLILVMNESFSDPEILGKDYEHVGGDIVPNLHEIFQKYPSGYMYSPEYGGNTANVEFAAFTSLSNYWSGSIPYVNSLSKISHIPGIVSFAKENGLIPTAIHAYDGGIYKRNFVYANMGFGEFLDANKMTHTEKENGNGTYISDSEVYKEILDVLNDGEEKHMVGAITMQNHAPYGSAGYSELHFAIKGSIENQLAAENNFESLYYSDKYLGEFINELDKLEGKTVMIWFGDHAAGVFDELMNSGNKSAIDLAHLTPYFVYANFELENVFTEKEAAALNKVAGFSFKTKGVDLPTVTPNCLANVLYDVLGVEKPAMLYLAAEVCDEVPILAPTYFADSELEMTEALSDYQIINYDILNGKRYSLK